MHQALATVAQDRYAGLDYLLHFFSVEVIAFGHHSHRQAAPVGLDQGIPQAPKIQIISGDIHADPGSLDGICQRFVWPASKRIAGRVIRIAEVDREPVDGRVGLGDRIGFNDCRRLGRRLKGLASRHTRQGSQE